MIIKKKLFKNVYLLSNKTFKDARGKFLKFDNVLDINKKKISFNQYCYSSNKNKFTLRGLHFQKYPYEEIKLITCIQGKIFDVVVDINKKSKTYLQWKCIELSENESLSLFIGKGYAHGFLTLKKNTVVLYNISGPYKGNFQRIVNWKDPKIGIIWPARPKLISKADKQI
jgi:dTDP-4-dehydrorhamnose 3,5-epimerase